MSAATTRNGAQMRIISFIFDPAVIHRILTHLEETGQKPERRPAAHEATPV